MPDPCHEYANCTDTDGSFTCTCRTGFTGDSLQCEGKVQGGKFLEWNRIILCCDCLVAYASNQGLGLWESHNLVLKEVPLLKFFYKFPLL